MVWRTTLAIAVGILLGGGAASFETQACAKPDNTETYCLTEEPQTRVANGMVGGAFASGGALLMIELWSRMQRPD